MRRVISALIVCLSLTLVFSPLRLLSQGGDGESVDSNKGEKRSELVDVKANIVYPYKVNDSTSVLCLVGEFAAQHNGAVITADSAVRYENERIECFGNVLINKNTTYAYCDRAIYNSDTNEALLYAPLVKVVDEDVTLYAYNFKFNTKTNVGEYWGKGVTVRQYEELNEEGEMEQSEEVLESILGYYYADTKRVIGVNEVELSGDKYEMQSDSAIYDMQFERAFFFDNTSIWNEGGEYIFGDLGDYSKELQLFRVERNSYLLTKEQEGWADSMEYYRETEVAIMRNNIQLDDTTNKSSAFADYAYYWGLEDRVLLTRNPVVLNYDSDANEQEKPEEQEPEEGRFRPQNDSLKQTPVDTLFLKGDTIIMVTKRYEFPEIEQVAEEVTEEELGDEVEAIEEEIETSEEQPTTEVADSLSKDKKTKKKRERKVKEPKPISEREIKQQQRLEEDKRRREIQLQAEQVREHRKLVERSEKIKVKINKRLAKGRDIYTDSMRLSDMQIKIKVLRDSIDGVHLREIAADSLIDSLAKADSLAVDEKGQDSTYRLVRAFRSVRAYRSDLQFICDSLSGNTADSLMQLFIDPVVWSDKNQIVAEQMDLYIYNGELDFAHFMNDPIMSSEVIIGDTIHYNQIKGKDMYAYFKDNQVYRNDVDGNVQTIYYMQDEQTGEPTTYAYVESGTATFLIEDRFLDGMIYRAKPTYTFAPLEKIPTDNSLYLKDFAWRISERPTRESIFDRQIRATQRERVDSLPRPQFPIRAKIDSDRKRMVRKGEWKDRDESVSEAATEWMKSLGFTPGEPRKEDEKLF